MKGVTTNIVKPFRRAHDGYAPRPRAKFRPKVRGPKPRGGGRRRHMRPKR